MSQIVVNFYKFAPLDHPETLKSRLFESIKDLNVLGTILLAKEGINGGLSGTPAHVEKALELIRSIPPFETLTVRKSFGETGSYKHLKIRVKDKVLAFPDAYEPDLEAIAETPDLRASVWQKKLDQADDNIVVLDTRNDYEYELGSFDKAEHLNISKFNDFPKAFMEQYANDADKDKTFLMFCTGGIRCEKAAAFARKQGFKRVFKLEGGIIKYFEEKGHSHWQGECFVFDHRAAIAPDRNETEWSFAKVKKKM